MAGTLSRLGRSFLDALFNGTTTVYSLTVDGVGGNTATPAANGAILCNTLTTQGSNSDITASTNNIVATAGKLFAGLIRSSASLGAGQSTGGNGFFCKESAPLAGGFYTMSAGVPTVQRSFGLSSKTTVAAGDAGFTLNVAAPNLLVVVATVHSTAAFYTQVESSSLTTSFFRIQSRLASTDALADPTGTGAGVSFVVYGL